MYTKNTIGFALASLLMGCPTTDGGIWWDTGDDPSGEITRGRVRVCTDQSANMQDLDLDISGVVIALNDGSVDCSQSVTLTLDDGSVASFGYTLVDADEQDITPPLDLETGETVWGVYRYKLVFGSVAGLSLEDDAGFVLAADEGGYAGALSADDIPFSVSQGEDVIGRERDDCVIKNQYEVIFEADDSVTLAPVASGAISFHGRTFAAYAISAIGYDAGRNCSISDLTDSLSWAVVR